MKKITVILLLAMLPAMMFSEVVFMPRVGFDIHKGIKNQMLDAALKKLINWTVNSGKKEGENPTYITDDQIPHSKPLLTMITVGLDMQFIHHGNGFTFFWNNEFSYSANFKAYEKFNYGEGLLPGVKSFSKNAGNFDEAQKVMLYSTEFLLGGTFRRENAFNIHFGIGLKLSITPGTLRLLKPAFSGERTKIPEKLTVMAIPAIGGTFGFTYYFNNVVGLSLSLNEFVGFGGFLSARVLEDSNGVPTKAIGYASMGFTNNFAMKLGLNLRVNGVRN